MVGGRVSTRVARKRITFAPAQVQGKAGTLRGLVLGKNNSPYAFERYAPTFVKGYRPESTLPRRLVVPQLHRVSKEDEESPLPRLTAQERVSGLLV